MGLGTEEYAATSGNFLGHPFHCCGGASPVSGGLAHHQLCRPCFGQRSAGTALPLSEFIRPRGARRGADADDRQRCLAPHASRALEVEEMLRRLIDQSAKSHRPGCIVTKCRIGDSLDREVDIPD